MIVQFRHKGLERLFTMGDASGVSPRYARKIRAVLAQLHMASEPAMMNIPGLRFHALRGDRKDQFAVSISRNWRIVFAFDGENATDVDLVDYH